VGGFAAKGSNGSSVKQGSNTAGRIPEGALVEREVQTSFVNDGKITLSLRKPEFGTAARLAKAVDKEIGEGSASAGDGGSVVVKVPEKFSKDPVGLIAQLEEIDVVPVRKSRVVISERNGTIVAGGDVRLAPSAVVHGNLTIVVKESALIAQPAIGQGTVVPKSEVQARESEPIVKFVPEAPTLAEVAQTLGSLGLSARELASVLSAMRTAGALEAEVVVE
jgi:flagellar P-ring protein precursor FlgI